jgi:hypothetical protein
MIREEISARKMLIMLYVIAIKKTLPQSLPGRKSTVPPNAMKMPMKRYPANPQRASGRPRKIE